jgi:neutral ceramidase
MRKSELTSKIVGHQVKTGMRVQFILLLLILMQACANVQTGKEATDKAANVFRASVVKVDITPDKPEFMTSYGGRTSTAVNDRLYHRIAVFDDGSTRFILVSSDICTVHPEAYDAVATQLQEKFSIRSENFWWAATHTHSAPDIGLHPIRKMVKPIEYKPEYVNKEHTLWAINKLIEGVTEALQKLEPAKIGTGWGFSNANINRRAINEKGKAILGMNPDGPIDHKIGLIRIDREDGSPIGLIVNYPIHGTVLGKLSSVISGDAPGIVSEYVQEKIGVPVLFINGAAGNVAPIYSQYPDPKAGHLDEFKVLLGDKVLAAYKDIQTTKDPIRLKASSITVETPSKKGLQWPQGFEKYTKVKDGVEFICFPIGFLQMNKDIVMWSMPIELFCEISSEIRDKSPFLYTFFFGYTNGTFFYLPTEEEFAHRGYEVKTTLVTPQAGKDLSEAVVSHLQEQMKNYK